MPRQARKSSDSGIYHVMMRGINCRNIFDDDEDRLRFVQILGELPYLYDDIGRYRHTTTGSDLLHICLVSDV